MWRATRRCPPPLLRWLSSDAASSKAPRRQRVAALWGNGDYGRLGLGALESRWSPTVCPFFLARSDDPPASLACGGAHTLFLTQSGRVFATGLNDFGQLGIGSSVTHMLEPVEVSGFHERVVEVSAGNHHSCAVTADGKLFVWGRNSGGQLGLGKVSFKEDGCYMGEELWERKGRNLGSRIGNKRGVRHKRLGVVKGVWRRASPRRLKNRGSCQHRRDQARRLKNRGSCQHRRDHTHKRKHLH